MGVQLWDFEGLGDLVLAAFMAGWVLELGEGAFGDAEFFEGLDFVEEFVGVGGAVEEGLIGAEGAAGGGGVFV